VNIQPVELQHFHIVWPAVEKFIATALDYAHGDYTIEQAKVYLARGDWLLLVATDESGGGIKGAAAVHFYNRPNDRVAFVAAVGGRFISGPEVFEQLKAFCKSHGATVVEGSAREAVARLWTKFGFTEKYRVVGVKI